MRVLVLAFALPLALLLGACADEAAERAYTNPQQVFRETMEAVHDGDLRALEDLLTKDARFILQADLRRLRENLASPRPDDPILAVAMVRLGEGYQAEVARAVEAGPEALLKFWATRLSPRERQPTQRGVRVDPTAQSMEFLYTDADGVERGVLLVQSRGRWYVSRLAL
ncbi:MAG: hypothetical protein O2894_06130 [Planctomycetota bacterium]|nr:hypothetical protein [Planctomycetota bacterium]